MENKIVLDNYVELYYNMLSFTLIALKSKYLNA
jgi:hypothetical protein